MQFPEANVTVIITTAEATVTYSIERAIYFETDLEYEFGSDIYSLLYSDPVMRVSPKVKNITFSMKPLGNNGQELYTVQVKRNDTYDI